VKVIHEKILDLTPVNVPIMLVGNKVDLHMERVISTEEGKKLADSMNAKFVEISAKQNSAVVEVFNTLIASIETSQNNENPPEKSTNKCVVS